MNKIYVVGLGPGDEKNMSVQAIDILEDCDVIVGYTTYISLLGDRFNHIEKISTGMRQETERCKLCLELAESGKRVALVCSGDAGIYGLASLMFELGANHKSVEIDVIPGISALNSGAALLGAPLNHDFCVISLSDLLTPWDLICKRLTAAAEGDFCMAIYNPASHHRPDHMKNACDVLLRTLSPDTACGYAVNIGRDNEYTKVCTLGQLRDEELNMFTTVFIGNSRTYIDGNKLITPRGYLV